MLRLYLNLTATQHPSNSTEDKNKWTNGIRRRLNLKYDAPKTENCLKAFGVSVILGIVLIWKDLND